jgi:hypothetical protein
MAMAWLLAAGPIVGFVALVASLVYLFLKLKDKIGTIGAAIATAFAAIAIIKFIKHVRDLVGAFKAARLAALAMQGAGMGGMPGGMGGVPGGGPGGGPGAGGTFFNGGYNAAGDKYQAAKASTKGWFSRAAGKALKFGGKALKVAGRAAPWAATAATAYELHDMYSKPAPADKDVGFQMPDYMKDTLNKAAGIPSTPAPTANVNNDTQITINVNGEMSADDLAGAIKAQIAEAQANGNRAAMNNLARNR